MTEEYWEWICVVVQECLEILPVLDDLPDEVLGVDSEHVPLVSQLDGGDSAVQRNEPVAVPTVTRPVQLQKNFRINHKRDSK